MSYYQNIKLRCSDVDMDRWMEAAKRSGLTLSEFVRAAADVASGSVTAVDYRDGPEPPPVRRVR